MYYVGLLLGHLFSRFVHSEKEVGKGYGGKNEDDEYYPVVANI